MTGILGAAALAGYAVALAVAVPKVLRRAGWVLRAPGLAIGMWLAVSVSWLTALVLAGVGLVRPWLASPTSGGPGANVVIAAVTGAGLAGGVLARAGYLLARELARGRGVRRRHGEALACAGRPAVLSAAQPPATIVDTETPAVYCLPGRGRRPQVVVTSGALRALDQGQLNAVLAHERAHLRCHHHLLTWTAGALALSPMHPAAARRPRGDRDPCRDGR